MKALLLIALCLMQGLIFAKTLKIAAWGGEIPASLIAQFEERTKTKVFLSTFESNESLLVKLKSTPSNQYDLITPSHYFIQQLKNQNLIIPLNAQKLTHLNEIDEHFLTSKTDIYGLPFLWSGSGIFYNSQWIHTPPKHWRELWSKAYHNKLLMLDDTREVFSMALLSLDLNPNNQNIEEIKLAYHNMLKLIPNIKLFASEALARIMVDEDALLGMAWNGDIVRTQSENPNLRFVYPEEGFVLSTECFAIPKNAQNIEEAYAFINFITDAEHSAEISKQMGYPSCNKYTKNYLPKTLADNKILYPDAETLKHGILQNALPPNILDVYMKLWEEFKLSF